MSSRRIIGQVNTPIRLENMRVVLFDLIVNQQIDPKTLKSSKVCNHAIDLLKEHIKDFFKQRWEMEKDHFEEHVGLDSWESHLETVDECFERLFSVSNKESNKK